jgi:recombination protein RecA
MSEWKKDIETEFGSDVYQTGFSGDVHSTGSFILDFLLGIGGYPCGAIVELFGSEGSWKTTLALIALKTAMEKGVPFLFLDFESTISYEYLRKLGIDVDKFRQYHIFPETMEDGFMVMKRFCERYEKGLIVVDSVAAMPPISDVEKMEKIIGQVKIGSQAQVMSIAMREMTRVFRMANCCVVFTNQERSKIDTMGRGLGRKTTPGGAAVKFYSAMRIQMEVYPPAIKEKRVDTLSGKVIEEVVGLNVQARVLKNRFAPSLRRATLSFRMDEGLDNITPALWIASAIGLVKKKGAFYTIDEKYSGEALGGRKEHGFERLRKYFVDNPEIKDKLLTDIVGYLSESKKGEESDDRKE